MLNSLRKTSETLMKNMWWQSSGYEHSIERRFCRTVKISDCSENVKQWRTVRMKMIMKQNT